MRLILPLKLSYFSVGNESFITMESVNKILVTDLSFWGGHHETYFMEILSILSEKYLVYACCVENDKLRQNINQNQLKNCQVIELNFSILDKILLRFLKLLDQALNPILKHTSYPIQFTSLFHLVATKRLMREIGEDVPVFFANADSAMPAVPLKISNLFMPYRWVGLQVLPSYQSKLAFGKIKSRTRFYAEKNFSLKSCRGILVLHPIYQRFFQKRIKNINCLYLPEIVEIEGSKADSININLIEKIKAKSTGKTIISILGNLTRKKNIILLMQSFLNIDNQQYFLLIIGKLKTNQYTQEELNLIQKYKDKVCHKNTYIDTNYFINNETEFKKFISLSDIIFLHYKNHPYSSHILTRSMALRKPVIVNKGFVMEKIVNQYDWPIATSNNPQEISNSIKMINHSMQITDDQYSSFLEDHSSKKIRAKILELCKQFDG